MARKDWSRQPDETIASEVTRRWTDSSNGLQAPRDDYRLNYAFVHGHHRVGQLAAERDLVRFRREEREGRTRTVVNRFAANLRTLTGKMTRNELVFEVESYDSSDTKLLASKEADVLLSDLHNRQGWETIRVEALLNVLIGSTAALAVFPTKAKFVLPDGERVPDLVDVRSYTINEFALEPGARTHRDARWALTNVALPPDQVADFYGMDECPTATVRSEPMPWVDGEVADLTEVLTLYQRPTYDEDDELISEGFVAHVVGNLLVRKEDWPEKDYGRDLPFYVARCVPNRNQWVGSTFLSDAREPQQLINAFLGISVDVARAQIPKMRYPKDSLEDEQEQLNDDPAQPWVYDPGAGPPPDYVVPGGGRITQHTMLEKVEAELDDIMHLHEISRGVAPGDRNAGSALAILVEQDESPLGVIVRDQQKAWQWVGERTLLIASSRRTKMRLDMGRTKLIRHWEGDKMHSSFAVHVPYKAVAPFSRAASMAELERVQQLHPQIFASMDPATAARLIDWPGSPDLSSTLHPDVSKAMCENVEMAYGHPQMVDLADDDVVHIEVHRRFIISKEWDRLPAQVKDDIRMHLANHEVHHDEKNARTQAMNEMTPGLGASADGMARVGAVPPPVAIPNIAVP